MIDQILNIKFGIIFGISIFILILIGQAARYYYKNTKAKEFSTDYIKEPISNSLTIISLLIPILVGVSSYFYINQPAGDYSLLWSAIFVLFITLVLAIWVSFTVLKIAPTGNIVKLSFPRDLRYIIALGLMYGSLIIGLVYIVLFFLFDLPSAISNVETDPITTSPIYLARPRVQLDSSKSEVEASWGPPSELQSARDVWVYEGLGFIIILEFDENGSLSKITEERR